jgi:SanA protein
MSKRNRDRIRRKVNRGAARRLKFPILAVLALALFGTGWTVWTLTHRYEGMIYTSDELASIPKRSVAIVFGAGYWSSGALSDILRDRLDAAIELYRAGRVQKLLLSGDNRVVEYNEPAKMREYALAQGIPDDDLVQDFAGRRTYDTCYRARDIFMVPDAILVTQRYHLPRTLATCQGLGIDSIGYVADRTPYVHIRRYWTRETFALWRTWWDLLIWHPKPVLGEPLPIFPG